MAIERHGWVQQPLSCDEAKGVDGTFVFPDSLFLFVEVGAELSDAIVTLFSAKTINILNPFNLTRLGICTPTRDPCKSRQDVTTIHHEPVRTISGHLNGFFCISYRLQCSI